MQQQHEITGRRLDSQGRRCGGARPAGSQNLDAGVSLPQGRDECLVAVVNDDVLEVGMFFAVDAADRLIEVFRRIDRQGNDRNPHPARPPSTLPSSLASWGLYSTCIDRLNSDLIPGRGLRKTPRSIVRGPSPSSGAMALPAAERRQSAALDAVLDYERP